MLPGLACLPPFHNSTQRSVVEKWGSGTTRMIAACREQGLPDREISESDGGFRVV